MQHPDPSGSTTHLPYLGNRGGITGEELQGKCSYGRVLVSGEVDERRSVAFSVALHELERCEAVAVDSFVVRAEIKTVESLSVFASRVEREAGLFFAKDWLRARSMLIIMRVWQLLIVIIVHELGFVNGFLR